MPLPTDGRDQRRILVEDVFYVEVHPTVGLVTKQRIHAPRQCTSKYFAVGLV